VLLVDTAAHDTAEVARAMAGAGLHVFWTAASEVGLRLSREYFFDVVLVDVGVDEDPRGLAEALARDGHRCVVLTADSQGWPPLAGQWGRAVEGALRRPLDVPRLARLAERLARTGDVDAFRRGLDLARPG